MEIDVIQSGSSGNCVILNGIIALDMGVSYNKVDPYIKNLQLVFVSHEHHDHFKESTIRRIAAERPTIRFCGGPFLAGMFTSSGVLKRSIDVLKPKNIYDYGKFKIEPVELYHDVQNYGLKIFMGGEKAIYITDTGFVSYIEAKDYDYYLLENNHEEEEIARRIAQKRKSGEYAYEIRTAKTHLSQEQAFKWLAENAGPKSKYVFLHQHKE